MIRLTLEERIFEEVFLGFSTMKPAPRVRQEIIERLVALLREPSADTGTTPSRDCVWTVEQNGAVHSVHSTYESAFKEEGENLRIGGPWQVLPWRAAERGTTPPEGLAFTFEEFIDMSLRHNKRLAAGISGIASFGHWYNEMLAATQRAPVEQGPRDQMAGLITSDMKVEYLDERGEVESISFEGLDECTRSTQNVGSWYSTAVWWKRNFLRVARKAAAPDHAREGALCNWYFGGFDGGKRCQKLKGHTDGHLWERALADGKEGGE